MRSFAALAIAVSVSGIAALGSPAVASARPPVTPLDTIGACAPHTVADPPVLLIHGTNADVEKSLGPVRQALLADGRCVYGLEYDSSQPLSVSVAYFAAAVETIVAVNEVDTIDVVGKSQGALIARAVSLAVAADAPPKIRTVVAVSGPHRGVSTVAGVDVSSFAAALPAQIPLLPAAVRDMLVGSPYLRTLNSGAMTAPDVRYFMIATEYDDLVRPDSALVDAPNVTNILVQDGCPEDHTGHIAGSTDPRTVDLVLNSLDPVRHPTVRCVANDDGK